MHNIETRPLLRALAAVGLALTTTTAVGAGFQISEQSVSGMGQGFAGAGIARDDAANLFYNPAGLLANPNSQLQFGASLISAEAKFTNRGSTRRLAGSTVPASGTNADGGEDVVVPAFYYTSQGAAVKWGIGISVPFGLATEYDDDWVGRYHALRSEVQAINVNPAVAVKLGDTFSIGAGVFAQRVDAELSQAVFRGPGVPDGKATLKGDDTDFGFNLGIMAEPTPSTRIGLGYRSKVDHKVEGNVRFSGVPGVPPSLPVESSATFPETVYASLSQDLGNATELSASIRWTRWSQLPELRIQTLGLPDSVADYQWQDVSMTSIGIRHNLNDRWTVRAGYARDESPIPADINRTPRVPDSDRDWFTFGLSRALSDTIRIDFAYARITGDDSSLVNTINLVSSAPGAFTDTLRGDYDASVNIFGIQIYGEF
jgi:long-chain fatty acid transport protein